MNKCEPTKSLVLAIDFDGCIVEEAYPEIGELIPNAKQMINQLYLDGHYIIIWTCRTGEALLQAEVFLLEKGIRFHKINHHHPKDILKYKQFGPKVGADVYVDDKQVFGLPTWLEIYEWITEKAQQ